MKKVYNWHGLDKYRFVPIPSDSDYGKVSNGLIASIKEGYTRRNIKRKMTAISRKLKLTKTTSDATDEQLNKSAEHYRQELTGDEDVDGVTGANLHKTRKNLRNRILAVSNMKNRDDILQISSNKLILDQLIKACDKATNKHSLLSLMKHSLGNMKEKWNDYCTTWDVKKDAMRNTLVMEKFFTWFCGLTKTKLEIATEPVSKRCLKLYELIKCCGQPTHVHERYGFIHDSVAATTLINERENGNNSDLAGILTRWRCKLRDIYKEALVSEKKKLGNDDNDESVKKKTKIWDIGKSYTADSLTDVLQTYRRGVANTLKKLSEQFEEYLNT